MIIERKKNRHPLFYLLSILFVLALGSKRAFAERPFVFTEKAIPVDRGVYRLDGGLSMSRFSSDHKQSILSAELRFGLIQNLEMGLELPYLFVENRGEHESQIGDLLFRTKIRFLKGREANPLSIAGELMIKLPSAGRHEFFGTTGEADIGFLAIASKEFSPVTTHLNFGYVFIGNPPFENRPDQLRYSLGFEFKTTEPTILILSELFGTTEVGEAASKGLLTVLLGMAAKASPQFSLDASAGFGLTQDSPDYMLNFGFTYLFR